MYAGIEWGHGVYLSEILLEIDFVWHTVRD